MTPKNTKKFTVKVDLPRGMTIADMCDYIQDAVKSHKGGFSLDFPVAYLDRDTVKVSRYKKTPQPKTKPPLRVFHNNSFEGPNPVGTLAIVRACTAEEAAKLLNAALDAHTVEHEPFVWVGNQTADSMVEEDTEEGSEGVDILLDGVY